MKNWLAVVAICCCVSLAEAQCCPGPLVGHVTDSTGAPVANATVTMDACEKPWDFGRGESATTKVDGSYIIQHPSWGPCTLTVKAAGFTPYIVRPFSSTIDTTKTVDVQLERAKQ